MVSSSFRLFASRENFVLSLGFDRRWSLENDGLFPLIFSGSKQGICAWVGEGGRFMCHSALVLLIY